MDYGSQGIFAEGRALDFQQEEGSGTQEHGAGTGSYRKVSKREADCERCGTNFVITKGSVGRYCSHECMNQHKLDSRPDWFECSKCLASIGLGHTVVSRLLGTSKSRLHRAWSKEGIKANLPECGEWRRYASKFGVFKGLRAFTECWWGSYATAWMSEYNPKFPDWSSIASQEIAKKRGRAYQSIMHATSGKGSRFRLKKICRSRIYNAIKRSNEGVKPRLRYRTEKMIACTVEQLRTHLEAKFKRGMNWDNHGDGWHIDHIIPCASFDLSEDNQLLQCMHYTNMQPMWAEQNLRKSDNIEKPEQMSLRLCATH